MPKVITEGHLLKLREDMVAIIENGTAPEASLEKPTDEIVAELLNLPLLKALIVDNMVDLPPERVGHLMRAMQEVPNE